MNQSSDEQQAPGDSGEPQPPSVPTQIPEQNGNHTQPELRRKGSGGIIHLLLILLLLSGGAALYFGFLGKDEVLSDGEEGLVEQVATPPAPQPRETEPTLEPAIEPETQVDREPVAREPSEPDRRKG